jgi:hypothetical protein
MLRPNEFSVCRKKGKSSMYATSMGHLLTQSSRALVVNRAGEAGQNCAYSLSMLTRLRLDAPLARPAADRVRQVRAFGLGPRAEELGAKSQCQLSTFVRRLRKLHPIRRGKVLTYARQRNRHRFLVPQLPNCGGGAGALLICAPRTPSVGDRCCRATLVLSGTFKRMRRISVSRPRRKHEVPYLL